MELLQKFSPISEILYEEFLTLIQNGLRPQNMFMFGFSYGGQLASKIGRLLKPAYNLNKIDSRFYITLTRKIYWGHTSIFWKIKYVIEEKNCTILHNVCTKSFVKTLHTHTPDLAKSMGDPGIPLRIDFSCLQL